MILIIIILNYISLLKTILLVLTLNNLFYLFCLIVSGNIQLFDYGNFEERTWPVYSNCQSVRIRSTMMKTEKKFDFITIEGTKYSGNKEIDVILASNFTVSFNSNQDTTEKGFVLNWNCLTDWEGWNPTHDGTCREAMMLKPEYLGPNLEHRTKYRKRNITCCKFILVYRCQFNLSFREAVNYSINSIWCYQAA